MPLPCLLVLMGMMTIAVQALALPAQASDGWLYVQNYLTDWQMSHYGGIAIPPVYVYDSDNQVISSDKADASHTVGTLIPVPPGEYYITAGNRNVGLTRTQYVVESGKVTEVQTGFIQVQTWPKEDIPQKGCNHWDGTMYVFMEHEGQSLPVMSNSSKRYATEDFGMIQLLVGTYRVGWNGFSTEVEIKPGQIFRLPLGMAGPFGQPRSRLSERQGESADNPNLSLCDDGSTQVLPGNYWLSSVRKLPVYPYEERVWSQLEVKENNESGYVRTFKPTPIPHPYLRGDKAQPQPASILTIPSSVADSQSEDDVNRPGRRRSASGLLGTPGINWDAPL